METLLAHFGYMTAGVDLPYEGIIHIAVTVIFQNKAQ